MLVFLRLLILVLWLAVSRSILCPLECTCVPFGKFIVVNCLGIDEVPTGIPSDTVMLQLSGNYLKSIHEGAFSNLISLKKIDLSRNFIKLVPLNTFTNLTSLVVINLSENRSEGGFHLPQSVRSLNLQENLFSFDDLRVILKGLNQLSSLRTDYNEGIGPVLTLDIFNDFERMDYLDLSKNMLSRLQPGALEGPGDSMIFLFLGNNKFRDIVDGTFKKFINLMRFDLSRNRITDISPLEDSGATHLGDLMMIENNLTVIPKDSFAEGPRLR